MCPQLRDINPLESHAAEVMDHELAFALRSRFPKSLGHLAFLRPREGSSVHGVAHLLAPAQV